MTLTEIKAKAVEKAKLEEAARAHEKLMRELDVHPLVKLKTERSVRDAYFYGIVFAALLDDLKVDSAEFKMISRIGNSLEIDNATQQDVVKDVEQAVAEAVAAGGQDVDVLLKETLSIVSDEHARLLFLAEFVKVCGAKELHVADVESILAPCMPELKKKEAYFKTVCKIVQEGEGASRADLLRLTEDLTDDEVRYWMLDVKGDVMDDLTLERQAIAQAKKVEEKQRQAEAKRLAEEADRKKERAAFDAWLEAIADQYDHLKTTVPKGVPAELSRKANDFDVSKLDFEEIKQKILSGLGTCDENTTMPFPFRDFSGEVPRQQRRMALKLLGYFALRFNLDDECPLVCSIEYLMKTKIFDQFRTRKTVVEAFEDCIAKYNV